MPLVLPNPRALLAILYDVACATTVWLGLFALQQVGPALHLSIPPQAWATGAIAVLIETATFLLFGLYRGIWRYASLHDLRRIAIAVSVSGMAVPTTILLGGYAGVVPHAIYVLNPLLLIVAMASGRIIYRWWKELPATESSGRGLPVLMLTSGDFPLSTVLSFQGSANWRLAGILDDRPHRLGRTAAGVRVLGDWEDLPEQARRFAAVHAVLADSGADHTTRRRAFEICERAGVKLMLMPAVDDLLSGRVHVSQLRDVELDDLLGRDPANLDAGALGAMLKGKVVMVTGAGGSIGAELCRQIARFDPALLVLYELNEYALYTIELEFQQRFPGVALRCLVGDVKDEARLEQVIARFLPSVVFHAAAYKHVPMMERDNAWSAVQNNVLGTLRLARAVARHPVERFVFVSTDKAVNPTSVMGATKRLGELLLQRWAQRTPVPTAIVRFGNVLGSTGSVVPKFRAQIAAGGPVTVTHPEMRRYFMSIPEASQLVLQSALMGEHGEIFVLDMGEPVRIVDLARDLIALSGFSEEEIRIEFIGLRPGEKLFEELHTDAESTLPTRHEKIRVAKPAELPDAAWEAEVERWLVQDAPLDDGQVRRGLARFIPEYQPFRESAAPAVNVIEFPHPRVA